MVRGDKEMLNLAKLSESKSSPNVLWEIANTAVGKLRQPLPASVRNADSIDTKGNLKAANVVNLYYFEKVQKIRAGRGVENATRESAARPRSGDKRGNIYFALDFANAGRISKIISGLKTTSSLGTDGIPVAVLKMGSDVLAGPISHLVNMSLSAQRVPVGLQGSHHPSSVQGGRESEE
jgi:hypothetical protein